MSACHEELTELTSRLSEEATRPFRNSRKAFVTGSRPDIRVGMRKIGQIPTQSETGSIKNPAITVYDTSGPYSDPDVDIDLARGLNAMRGGWIEARSDTVASDAGPPLSPDIALFVGNRRIRRAAAGVNVTQMHYARSQGIDNFKEAIERGLDEKANEFRQKGANMYSKR